MERPILDRAQRTPTLIKTFFLNGKHHEVTDFLKGPDQYPENEFNLYTWPDSTLQEIALSFLKITKISNANILHFQFIKPHPDSGWQIQDLGEINLKSEVHDIQTIDYFGFKPGYMLDIAYRSD